MLKTVIVLSCIVALAFATPLPDDKTGEKKTEKRSALFYDVAPAISTYQTLPATTYISRPTFQQLPYYRSSFYQPLAYNYAYNSYNPYTYYY